tara:strand:- start:10905 stop:11237 length:333 start_codon:yes stop_codon:yes gene_type:complete
MEKLGREPDPDKMPLEIADFPFEVQIAFFIHSLLPDKWDGASGTYMGKDWSALMGLFDIYEVEHKKDVAVFLKKIDIHNMQSINNKLDKQRKKDEVRTSGNTPTLPKIRK